MRAAQRRKLRKSQFAAPKGSGPDRSKAQYPVDTKGRAVNAKGRARQQLNKGKLSRSTYNKIVAKANRVIKRKGGAKSTSRRRRR